MAQEAINVIKKTEEEGANIINEAENKAAKIISDAGNQTRGFEVKARNVTDYTASDFSLC